MLAFRALRLMQLYQFLTLAFKETIFEKELMTQRGLPSVWNHQLGKSVYPDTIRSLVLCIKMSQTNADIL
jgi:hypothetical protein